MSAYFPDDLDHLIGTDVTVAYMNCTPGGISMVSGTLSNYEHFTSTGSDGLEVWLQTTFTLDDREYDAIGVYEVMQNQYTNQEEM